jgi:hypothetical protein
MEDLDTNSRLRLLQLRDQGEPEFRGLCVVPLREKEIPKDVFKVNLENQAYEFKPALGQETGCPTFFLIVFKKILGDLPVS